MEHECPNGNILCFPDSLCPECIEDEALQEEQITEQITRHVASCKADGFCYICQCL